MTIEKLLIETVGWTGAGLILGGYMLLSSGRLTGQSRVYQSMNVIGAVCFIINSGWYGAIPSVALNVVWLLIGAVTLWRLARLPA